MQPKIAFIVNPISGVKSKKNIPALIDSLLDKSKFEPHVFYTERAGHATELAQYLSCEGYPYIVAVGGDGTVNEVGRGLVHTKSAMGIVPLGSGNGLARHLKIPLNTSKAIEYLNHAKVIDVDYGKANHHIFFCTCGVGFDAHISQQFALAGKRGLKTYLEKIIIEYFFYKPQKYRLKNDEVDIEQEAFLITFANASQYGNNAFIAPHADLQDGMMDVCVLSNFPFVFAPELALRLFTKKIDKSHYIFMMKTDKVRLIREQAGSFHFDGEAGTDGEVIDIQIVRHGLKVFVQ